MTHPGGRPRLPIDETRVLELYAEPGASVNSVAIALGVDRARVRRVVDEAGVYRAAQGGNILQLPLHAGQAIPPRDERDWVTSAELIAEADITYRRCDYWNRTGLLHPLEEPNPGSGLVRRYPLDQIDRARALKALLDIGMSLETCRDVIDQVLATGHATLGAVHLTYQPQEASA